MYVGTLSSESAFGSDHLDDPLKNQKFLTRVSALVTVITALVFLPVFGYFSQPGFLAFYLPLLVAAAIPMHPAMQDRITLARVILFVSTNGLAIVTAMYFGPESHINIAALVGLCHTLLVTRIREVALLGFGFGLATCTLLVYHIVPESMFTPTGRHTEIAPQLGVIVEFTAVAIVAIQIIILRLKLSERSKTIAEYSNTLRDQLEQLRTAHDELKAAQDSNASLVRILCHDLATPIATAELCLKRKTLTERDCDILRRSIQKSKETLSDVRELQRLHASKLAIEKTPENLTLLLQDLRESFAAELNGKELTLTLETPSQPVFGMVDRSLVMNQIFSNVLRNAIKFSKRGSEISVTIEAQGERVGVTFRDYGIGIPPDLLSKLFDPTQKTSRPGTEKESGTGFGMPIIKACMEEMGGTVSVASWPEPTERNLETAAEDSAEANSEPTDRNRRYGTAVTLSFALAEQPQN